MPPAIAAQQIVKVYPNGFTANRGVDFAAEVGQIHALIGENGAGKSTLMKILYGLEQPTSGQIFWQGQPVRFPNPEAAIRQGVGMVHQNFMLIPSFTVAQNVTLNAEPRRAKILLNQQMAVAQTKALAAQYGLQVTPEARVDDIPVGMKQRVEILKALYRGAQVFILDEPTAVLTPSETDDLFVALRRLAKAGKTIIFISHKLREVLALADQITVLRDGQVVGAVAANQTSEAALAQMMVGRALGEAPASTPQAPGPVVLRVRNLTCLAASGKRALDNVSFDLHSGEILGVAGVEGNGQTELAELLAGLRAPSAGSIEIDGGAVGQSQASTPRQMRTLGIAHIPEDRLSNGAGRTASIAENLIVDRYYRPPFQKNGLLQPHVIAEQAKTLIQAFGVAAPSGQVAIGTLSGGNMQKVIVARELSARPRLLLAAQPTRGVDIGAIAFIHQALLAQRAAGLAILLISADLQEVVRLSDRLIVMHNGQITATFANPHAVSEAELGLYMLGAKQNHHEGAVE
jgi:general nucleoside transport system ATP-binding protein